MNLKIVFRSILTTLICLPLVSSQVAAQDLNAPSGLGGSGLGLEESANEDFTEETRNMVNPRFAGWQEVTHVASGDRVSETLRGNWIMVDSNGRFDGSVTAAAGADVSRMQIFLLNRGRLVKQTALNAGGRFEFNNVSQGAYSIIGWGENGFFAFGLNILQNNPNNKGEIGNRISATAFQNRTTINTDWIKYYSPQVKFRVFGAYSSGQEAGAPAALLGFKGLAKNLPTSVASTSLSSRSVSRLADGRLVGRVHQMNSLNGRPVDVRSTKVMLFQGDIVVASTTTDNYGTFAFNDVPDGSYGLAAVGADGVGLIGIGVSSEQSPTNNISPKVIDFTMTSAETTGWLNNFAGGFAYRRALLAPRPEVAKQDPALCPGCGGQPGGCSQCDASFAESCKSRSITFEQWSQWGCETEAQKYGDGSILAAWAAQQRKNVKKNDARFEKAFFPNESLEGFDLNQPTPTPAPQN
ncbi:carboxypeptidase-like regulatory domain-containing protein [Mariniblastus sp.]|nr:carboxypeptidase-like regulatory domain-containing protein [Mariniblastus sp.]